MALEQAVLIKLTRTEFSGTIELQKRQQLNATDGVIFSLFEQAKQQFNRSAAKRFGFFDSSAEHKQLIGLINNWQAESINFLSFANKSGEQLQQLLDGSETPFNAVILIAQESILGQNYLYLFWLATSEVIQSDNDLEPYKAEVIEADKVLYGFRLHLDEWQAGDSPKYLTCLTSKGNKDLGDNFKAFCNFSEGIDISQQTNEFLDIVDSFSTDLPEEQSKAVKAAVIDYCVEKDKVGSPVLVEEISEQLSQQTGQDNPKQFSEYVSSKQEAALNEIHTDRQSLKRYMRYFGRDNSLSISFSAERFGEDITYDPAASSLTINKLPKNLKVQLSGYADKSNNHD